MSTGAVHSHVARGCHVSARMNILCTRHAGGRSAPRDTTALSRWSRPHPTPSARLVRAAAAERAELGRHRERLLSARASLRAELQAIEASLRELDERDALLDRLAGAAGSVGGPRAAGVARSSADGAASASAARAATRPGDPARRGRGPARAARSAAGAALPRVVRRARRGRVRGRRQGPARGVPHPAEPLAGRPPGDAERGLRARPRARRGGCATGSTRSTPSCAGSPGRRARPPT